jgi:hypothetical protein
MSELVGIAEDELEAIEDDESLEAVKEEGRITREMIVKSAERSGVRGASNGKVLVKLTHLHLNNLGIRRIASLAHVPNLEV